ncbi:MAG: zinc-dependent metalloprotease [Casimicrobiaceae bacterium]
MSMWARICRGAALAGACVLTGCATLPETPGKEGAAAAAPSPSPSPQAIANAQRLAGAPGSSAPTTPAPAPSALRTFAEVSRDAKEHTGLFRLWQKDEKVWLEIAPEQFEHAYFFSTNLDQGLGESRFLAGSMSSSLSRRFGGPAIVVFHKVGGNVQMIARNVKYTAQAGTPEARAVADAFSDSLLATAAVVSQPHPERKSVLVEANALFFTDLPGAASRLEQSYRQSYAFDARNSSFREVRSTADFVSLNVMAHYALARVMIPQPGQTTPEPPSTIPDIRSLFLGFHYSLAKLPDNPMKPRAADPRIGYFGTDVWDFTTDDRRIPIVHYVNRWRLEKKDPAAALSEPKQPIVYWIDRSVPEKYHVAIRDGVLEWNKAFERLGYKNAVRVEIQPANADFNTSDIRHASIRWMTTARSGFAAIGPSVVDPRTGEILDADIGIDATSFRALKSYSAETIPARPSSFGYFDAPYCTYAAESSEHAGFAMSLLEARGEMTMDGPEAEAFIQSRLKSTTMHEVGHTLGLTHNFRASTVYTEAQLADREFTTRNGIAGSVMEYNAINIALKGETQGEYHMSTLGPYDYWAIEYGYRELAAGQEAEELARIAARSNEPLLAFMADDSLFYSGLDPLANTFDLGADPLLYAQRQLKLGRELWQLTESKALPAGENYALLRRNFNRGLFEVQQSALQAVKYIGGLTLLSDHAGTGRPPLEPVVAAKQRAALDLLAETIFSADNFRFQPSFLRKLAINDQDIDDAKEMGRSVPTIDIAVDQQVLVLHRAILGPLLGPEVAQRLLNNELKVSDPKAALRLADLYAALHAAIFSEIKAGKDVPLIRRNLQREYVSRVATVIVRPAALMPADARALLRADAVALRDEMAAMQKRPRTSVETRAHVAESLSLLDEALKAPMMRQAL